MFRNVSIASRILFFALAMILVSGIPANAIVITNSDIWNDNGTLRYNYEIRAIEMSNSYNSPPGFLADASTVTNMTVNKQGGTYWVEADIGQTLAAIEFTFDFSQTGKTIDSVEFRDRFTIFGGESNVTNVISEFSVDGGNTFTTITQGTSTPGSTVDFTTGLSPLPTFDTGDFGAGVTKLIYRASFTNSSGFAGSANQWNRTGTNQPTFEANFVVVPEPASLALLGLGIAAMLRRRVK